nr:bolA-like protein 3 isoform X2 [Manis javanica]
MDSLYVGHQGPWDQGRSADRAELPGRVSGQRRAGGWSQPREAQTCSGGVARGLRAVEGGLACGSGSRSPAPRLPGDPVTSDGGPRRPGMAAWSPAAAAPMLRGTRGEAVEQCMKSKSSQKNLRRRELFSSTRW